MIPKIIYTTWCSPRPFPKEWEHCIASWRKYMPDYKIVVLGLKDCPDNKFVRDAISAGKYVMAGHYIRCQKLYETGGIYCDIDIEAVKSFNPLLKEEMFVGHSAIGVMNNAIYGCVKGHKVMEMCMEFMDGFDVRQDDAENKTGPIMLDTILRIFGWDKTDRKNVIKLDGVTICPPQYFYPFCYNEKFQPMCVTADTYCIHWWGTTWTSRPGVSIIIPCFNHGDTLANAIESALSLNGENEVIVVNDGSTDNTKEVASRYPVIYLEQENKGLSSARNLGIGVSSKEIILPLDADDTLLTEGASELLEKFANDKEADIYCGNVMVYRKNKTTVRLIPSGKFGVDDFLNNNQLTSAAPFRRTLWDKLHGYWECPTQKNICEDWDFWGRAAKIGARFKYLNVDYYNYIQSEDGMCANLMKTYEKEKAMIGKHIKEWGEA